jgi:hypothetical protein
MKIKNLFLLAAVAFACTPDVGANPSAADGGVSTFAVFDPTTGNIPLPNDLGLAASAQAGLPAAQQQLDAIFVSKGGFPSDQELPVTIQFQTQANTNGTVTSTAPDIDTTTFVVGKTIVVFQQTGPTTIVPAPIDPIQPTDYVKGPTSGTLSIHNAGRKPWAQGEYILGVRGGANGVKTKDGTPIVASSTFFLVAQGNHLNNEADIALLRAQAGSTVAAQALATQLDALIDQYNAGPFQVIKTAFPPQELAAMTTFLIAPTHSVVEVDANRGIVPLPIDLLRDPRPVDPTCAACGHLTPVAACTFAQGTIDPATGVCSQAAAAAGFATLDGFSTTGMIIAPMSTDLVPNLDAATVTPQTVQLYDLTDPANPVKVDPTTYITEPAEVQAQVGTGAAARFFSPIVALQPAGATANDPTSVFRTKPLKENTNYAVVISDSVLDQAGNHLQPGTVASVLTITSPLSVGGKSQLSGIDDATAAALEAMRLKLQNVFTTAAANGIASNHVVMAYTFKTQSFLTVADQLGALPYQNNANPQDATFNTAPIAAANVLTPGAALGKYGLQSVGPTAVPNGNINEVIETTITTFNLIDPTTGAFNPDPTKAAAETINVLIATPKLTAVTTACAGALAPFGKCSPLLVFRHGLGEGRADMLTVADTFTAQGYTVVAIDAAKHGDRSFCTSGAATISLGGANVPQCATGSSCITTLPPGTQADAAPIGCCVPAGGSLPASFPTSCGASNNNFFFRPVSSACNTPGACNGFTGTAGIPVDSANFLVTANFFRTRDTLRQDFIDESQLVRAIAFAPTGPPPTGHNLFDHTVAQGFIVDPTNINFLGQSLGSIQGTGDVATNPRITKAVLNVGGGTVVDIFTNSPAFQATTNALLASLGIQPGTQAFLQFLIVAKTVLDPADPVNFSEHLLTQTLPDLLTDQTGATPQAAKKVLTQAAFCDQTVPNPFEFILDSNISCGLTPAAACAQGPGPLFAQVLPPTAPNNFELFFKNTGATPNLAACPAPPTSGAGTPGAVTHGFITDFADPAATTAAQTDAAAFLTNPANLPPSLRVVP